MKTKINKILLIDDSEPINFIHRYILDELGCVDEIITKENGEEAIDYLISLVNLKTQLPKFIFIDINMPRMNAWEFITEYRKIDSQLRLQSFVFLLTSSIDPTDLEKARGIVEINEVRDKPFNEMVIQEIIAKYR